MRVIVVKNPVMVPDSQVQVPKLWLSQDLV